MVEPTGYTALDLIGFTDKGPYDPTANYVKNDLVHVGNSTWRCKIDDTTGITPTEGANWTIFIESATSLAGMSDVDLNTPKAGDGLVHNGNDWTNIPIMTKDQWKKNGAYNLLPNNATSQVIQNVTFTVNSDGSVTANGTATATAWFEIGTIKSGTLSVGSYKLTGCPSGGSVSGYRILFREDPSNVFSVDDFGDGVSFTIEDSSKNYKAFIGIGVGVTVSNLTFKPMITTDLNATYDDYVEYAKTNRELTEDTRRLIKVAEASANNTWATQLTSLYAAWSNLSDADKCRAVISAGDTFSDGAYRLMGKSVASFSLVSLSGTGITTMILLRLSNSTARQVQIATNGTVTSTDISSNTNTGKLVLYLD